MRRGPLRRGKPPQARAALTRKTPLVDRSGGPKRTPFRPSKPTVTAAERSARKVVTARADGCCEGCGRPGPTDYSHRIGAGVGGPWHPANALALDRARVTRGFTRTRRRRGCSAGGGCSPPTTT